MIELGLASDVELAVFGAPLNAVAPAGASSVAVLDKEGHADTAKAPWREIARGLGWWTSWRWRDGLRMELGISRVTWDQQLVLEYASFGNDGFSVAIIQASKCFYSREAAIIGFGSQGDRNHLLLRVSKDGGLR